MNNPIGIPTSPMRWRLLSLVSIFGWPIVVRNQVAPRVLYVGKNLDQDISGWSKRHIDELGKRLGIKDFANRLNRPLSLEVKYTLNINGSMFHAYMVGIPHGVEVRRRPGRGSLKLELGRVLRALDEVRGVIDKETKDVAESAREAAALRIIEDTERQQSELNAIKARQALDSIQININRSGSDFHLHLSQCEKHLAILRTQFALVDQHADALKPLAQLLNERKSQAANLLREKSTAHEAICRHPSFPPNLQLEATLRAAFESANKQHAIAWEQYQSQWEKSKKKVDELDIEAKQVDHGILAFVKAREDAQRALLSLQGPMEQLKRLKAQIADCTTVAAQRQRVAGIVAGQRVNGTYLDRIFAAGAWHCNALPNNPQKQQLMTSIDSRLAGLETESRNMITRLKAAQAINTDDFNPWRENGNARRI